MLVAAVAASAACDATVALDTTRPTFTRILSAGACATADNLSEFDHSVLLLNKDQFILPNQRLRNERQPLSEVIEAGDFDYNCPVERASCGDGEGAAQSASNPTDQQVNLLVEEVEFRWSGGEERQSDERLVILMMDNSVSLIGGDPQSPTIDTNRASDPNRERITFFRELVSDFPTESSNGTGEVKTWVSVMKFDSLPIIESDCASPSVSRDVTNDCLNKYSRGEDGPTNMWDALNDVYTKIITSDAADGLNPTVILFTDGNEGNDASATSMADAMRPYIDNQIPVLVVQLQPPRLAGDDRQGRTADLVDFACETSGQHFFLERPNEFSARRDLRVILRNRVAGAWNLRVRSTLGSNDRFPAGNEFFLSTELSGTVADITRAVEMSRSTDTLIDNRLWFNK